MRKLSKIILSVFYGYLILFSQKTMSAQKEQINQHLIFQQTLIKGKSNLNKWESNVKLISAKLITHEESNNHDFR
ncbi:MAG: hypothetical protein P8J28_04210, partial [Polaribacter sp.]|nr:hypothetical protein [Polaribacter sp.]